MPLCVCLLRGDDDDGPWWALMSGASAVDVYVASVWRVATSIRTGQRTRLVAMRDRPLVAPGACDYACVIVRSDRIETSVCGLRLIGSCERRARSGQILLRF